MQGLIEQGQRVLAELYTYRGCAKLIADVSTGLGLSVETSSQHTAYALATFKLGGRQHVCCSSARWQLCCTVNVQLDQAGLS